MMKERLLQRAEELIEMGKSVLGTRYRREYVDEPSEFLQGLPGISSRRRVSVSEQVDSGKMKDFRTASLSFIAQIYGENHCHYCEFYKSAAGSRPGDVENGLGILHAIQGEIAGDWLFTVKDLVTAEVFTDYMDMAKYLLGQGYKDAAVVIAGSTLEEHLRQLCRKNRIPVTREQRGEDVPVKADQLNANLAKAAVYDSDRQKYVTAWLGTRNSAAHGKYDAYSLDDVNGMIAGIVDFIASASL